jgi:hypothetical protein
MELSESDLISCALYLQDLFKTCQGDVPKLRDRLVSDFKSQKYSAPIFYKVLDDNIAASKQAGYENKEKVFGFLKTSLKNEEAKPGPIEESQDKVIEEVKDSLSTHHAPKFVDDELVKGVSLLSDIKVTAPETFIDASSAVAFTFPSATQNNKKKSERKEARKRAAAVAAKLGAHLAEHGWAVCDNFIPMDIVRRIRIEVTRALSTAARSPLSYHFFA